MNWIKTEKELPPCDDIYEVCNRPNDPNCDAGLAIYDGFGFISCGIYRHPEYWRKVKPREKKYGKII